jgi:protein ImuB
VKDAARRLGIDTVGALAALPRAPLVRRFGRAIVARLDEALGARAQPLDLLRARPKRPPMRRFAEPLLTAEPIATHVELVPICAPPCRRASHGRACSAHLTRPRRL